MGNVLVEPSIPAERLAEMKRETLELLAQDRQRLLLRFPFTAAVMMRLELVAVRDRRLRTAATDGRKVYIDIAFASDLSENDRRFVLAHETWHCILLHFVRRGERDPELFNVAIDMEVNRLLQEEGFKVPNLALLPDPKWGRISAEEIYERLMSQLRRRKPKSERESPGVEGQFDRHCDQSDNSESSAENAPRRSLAVYDKWGEVGYDAEYGPLVVDARTADELRGAVVSAAMQHERSRGTLPAHIRQVLSEVLKGEVDWRERLAQFVTSVYGGSRRWLPPSRRHLWQGIYLQSVRQEKLRAVVAVDTSGSVVGDLPQFFGELEGLIASFGAFEITVIQCDAEVGEVATYDESGGFDARKMTWTGGGGTRFCPVFDYINEHPDLEPTVLLYLTDGYGDAPETPPDYPVLWVLKADGRAPAEWGEVMRLKGATS